MTKICYSDLNMWKVFFRKKYWKNTCGRITYTLFAYFWASQKCKNQTEKDISLLRMHYWKTFIKYSFKKSRACFRVFTTIFMMFRLQEEDYTEYLKKFLMFIFWNTFLNFRPFEIYYYSLCEKCPNTEFFLVRIFPYSVRILNLRI